MAGASGVIGRRLVPRLVELGHEVVGLTRHPSRVAALEAMGATSAVGDVLDADRVREAVVAARPDIVVQHLTDLPQDLNPRNLKQAYERNDRVRGMGSAHLVAAAEAAGARRFVAQNVSFLYAPAGPPVVDEDAPLYTDAPEPFGRTVRLHVEMERRIIENERMEGLGLRFGFWYGPGTSFAADGYTAGEVRRRRYPIIGDGGGVFSFVHIDDVADATIAALERGRPGAYNVVDDEPAPVREWLPYYADVLGAKRPLRVPRWVARLAVGAFAAAQATTMRGASNVRAKGELGWTPRYPSWRDGFVHDLRRSADRAA
ncbi:MAG: NAD-dependent epimerase/dehydratase family protein [Actinomycetota bacterium]